MSAAAIQSEKGFDGLIYSIVDSAEYAEVFGDLTIAYVRSLTSASGMSMLNFVRIAAWVGGNPPIDYEKLWRGLALVDCAHLAGMLVNVVSDMLEILLFTPFQQSS